MKIWKHLRVPLAKAHLHFSIMHFEYAQLQNLGSLPKSSPYRIWAAWHLKLRERNWFCFSLQKYVGGMWLRKNMRSNCKSLNVTEHSRVYTNLTRLGLSCKCHAKDMNQKRSESGFQGNSATLSVEICSRNYIRDGIQKSSSIIIIYRIRITG